MTNLLKRKWVVPIATVVLTLSIGSAAFAATGSPAADSPAASAATSTSTPATSKERGQRSDETLLTGTTAEQVKAAAMAKVGSDATVERVETDADGNAAYEAHVTKVDGTHVTVYVDESFNVVSVEERGAGGGHRGGHGKGADGAGTGITGTTGTTSRTSSTSGSTSTSI